MCGTKRRQKISETPESRGGLITVCQETCFERSARQKCPIKTSFNELNIYSVRLISW